MTKTTVIIFFTFIILGIGGCKRSGLSVGKHMESGDDTPMESSDGKLWEPNNDKLWEPNYGNQTPATPIKLSPVQYHAAVAAQSQLAAVDRLQMQVEKEQTAQHDTEVKLQQVEVVKSRWQSTAFITISAGLVLLIVGVALGSKALRDHEARKN